MEFDIKRAAKLSRIGMTPEQEKVFSQEIGTIMEYLDQLSDIDQSPMLLDKSNTMELRADVVEPSMPREILLKNAPQTANGCYLVPKTVD